MAPALSDDGSRKVLKANLAGRYSIRVEVKGRYLNHSDQRECLRNLLENGPIWVQNGKNSNPKTGVPET